MSLDSIKGVPYGPARLPNEVVAEDGFIDECYKASLSSMTLASNGSQQGAPPLSPRLRTTPTPRRRSQDHINVPPGGDRTGNRSPRINYGQRPTTNPEHLPQLGTVNERARGDNSTSHPLHSRRERTNYHSDPRRHGGLTHVRGGYHYGDDESPYKTPRRIHSDDGVSSDSGIQHMAYDGQPPSVR